MCVCLSVIKLILDYKIKTTVALPAMILKIFDSLTSLDQLLLKCASVLGEIVNRSMVQYLLEDKTAREIGVGK